MVVAGPQTTGLRFVGPPRLRVAVHASVRRRHPRRRSMKTGAARARRSVMVAAAGILAVVLTACTGRGGGQLPPQGPAFNGAASFGFQFSCEDKGGINPPTGKLAIQLSYSE